MCGLTRLQTSTWSASQACAVDVQRKTFGRAADDHGFHAGADRAADRCLGDAVGRQDFKLAFRGAAAVAAHRGHEKRPGAQDLEKLHGRPQDRGDIGDTPAAGGDGDALSRLHAAVQLQPAQLRMDLGRHIRHAGPRKVLSHAKDLGKGGHFCCYIRDGRRGSAW